jgi:hypothetical protein
MLIKIVTENPPKNILQFANRCFLSVSYFCRKSLSSHWYSIILNVQIFIYRAIDHCDAFKFVSLLEFRGDMDIEIDSDAFMAFWLLSN